MHAQQPVGRRAARQGGKEQRIAQFTIKVFKPRTLPEAGSSSCPVAAGSSSSSTSVPASSGRWAGASEAHAVPHQRAQFMPLRRSCSCDLH
eukprot:6936600-Heterocapsa_arctica.AAC.1